jgi:hypothetical protein
VDGQYGPILGIGADMSTRALRTICGTPGVTTPSDPPDTGGCVAPIAVASAVQR